jgi:FtsP/CotA-like multicopper oxidase with cupredoxin domain
MAGGTGLIHLALVPEHLRFSYLGALFIAGGLASVFVAVRLWRGCTGKHVWVLGATASGAMAAGLIASRVVGLPGAFGAAAVQEDEWGVLENASLLFELGFLTVAFVLLGELRARKHSTAGRRGRATRPAGEQMGGSSPTAGGVSRRRALAAVVPVAGTAATARLLGGPSLGLATPVAGAAGMPAMGHAQRPVGRGGGPTGSRHMGGREMGFRGGSVDHRANGFDPSKLVRDFDWGKTRRLANGRVLREWEIAAYDKDIEVAPGISYPAWTYNGRIPGPSLRCHEGELLRINFVNGSAHPHTMHFHGIHPVGMDGTPGSGTDPRILVKPGQRFAYEFDATPFGMHLYHCHVHPLAIHIAKGLYGAFIVDPKRGRPEADELLMIMNGFNTNFDGEGNQVYAVNTVGFAYEQAPIKVKRGELVRIYLANMLEFDPINSLHIHANFFDYYPTGTSLRPSEYTDTIAQVQGQRGILEVRFPYAGKFLFHAHKTEFAELGWLGFFEVED